MTAELPGGGTVGRYRILRTLGSGAMGVVYLAEDPQIERLLAIKTVRIGTDEPAEIADRRERLLREAKTAGRLIHPHVVTLFDAGEEGGTLYLAFEYVEGSNLAERLQGPRPLTLAEALRIGREAATGLAFAHRQGIVHRDVKPANLLLSTDGTVKISDFGIAKVLGQATELTMTGTVIGSPHYLSPEQVRGEELDGRSDLFSLGVVLYELLGDRRPFDGDTLTTLLYQILHQEPPPMVLRPGVPERLTELLSRLLAKERDERFASADQVAAAIAALEAELPAELLARPAVLATPAVPAPPAVPAGEVEPTRLLPITGVKPVAPGTRPGEGSAETPPVPAAPARGGGRRRLAIALGVLFVAAGSLLAAYLLASRLGTPAGGQVGPDEAPETVALASVELEAGDLTAGDLAAGTDTLEPDAAPPAEPSEASAGPGETTAGPGETTARGSASPPRSLPEPEPERRPRDAAERVATDTAPPPADLAEPEPESEATATDRAESGADVATPRLDRRRSRRAALREAVETRAERLAPDQVVETGLSLVFEVRPADSFLLLDGTVIGRASDHAAGTGSPYLLPGAGEYQLKVRSAGMEDHRILVRASASGPAATTVSARLAPARAAELAIGDLPIVRVQSAVAFEVVPATALVEVDGRSVGRADQYPGRFGRPATWLRLAPGRHRLSLTAPGHQRRDFAVDVSDGAEEAREKIRVVLPPSPTGDAGRGAGNAGNAGGAGGS